MFGGKLGDASLISCLIFFTHYRLLDIRRFIFQQVGLTFYNNVLIAVLRAHISVIALDFSNAFILFLFLHLFLRWHEVN